jgi:hypothetical protein
MKEIFFQTPKVCRRKRIWVCVRSIFQLEELEARNLLQHPYAPTLIKL